MLDNLSPLDPAGEKMKRFRRIAKNGCGADYGGDCCGSELKCEGCERLAQVIAIMDAAPLAPSPKGGMKEDLDGSASLADAARQIRENIEAVEFTTALWEPSEYVVCLCGKPVGDTQTPHDADVIKAWLKVAWREIAEELLKVSPAAQPADASEADQSPSSPVGPVVAILAEMDTFGARVLSGNLSDETIGGMAPVIVGAWADRLRAALPPGRPQQGGALKCGLTCWLLYSLSSLCWL